MRIPVRAVLAVDKEGSVLSLRTDNEKLRVVLTVCDDGPVLSLYDENGNAVWSPP